MRHRYTAALLYLAASLTVGCAQTTDHLPAVTGFDAERYMGTWYELARYDHRFERGLVANHAFYQIMTLADPDDEPRIRVVNTGYDADNNKTEQVEGVARFAGASDVGELEVQFVWPIWGAYRIVALNDDYTLALVTSDTYEYFWLLARNPELPAAEKDAWLDRAEAMGFRRERMIDVDQTPRMQWVRPGQTQ